MFQGPDRQNFRLSTPQQRCRKWFCSPRQPGRAFQVPTPPLLGMLDSIVSLMLINQALGHPRMRFSGSRRTELLFIHPLLPKRCRKGVFSPREPGRPLQVPNPPMLGVLNSIMSLILINQALRHPKMCFSGSRPTELPFIHPPPNGAENEFFHLMSPAGHFRYPLPLFWGCSIQLSAKSQ